MVTYTLKEEIENLKKVETEVDEALLFKFSLGKITNDERFSILIKLRSTVSRLKKEDEKSSATQSSLFE